ncbi:hypothetical protein PEC301879_20190 [Pectobacterium carotovorum subsp. carotovorum]|nr:hypothetical protein PEC301879_20190 [Pectobacterium carotovorum subsp. carotovorum]
MSILTFFPLLPDSCLFWQWREGGRLSLSIMLFPSRLYPSYFKLYVRWLRSVTRITYLSKLIGIPSLAAFLKLELFRVSISNSGNFFDISGYTQRWILGEAR